MKNLIKFIYICIHIPKISFKFIILNIYSYSFKKFAVQFFQNKTLSKHELKIKLITDSTIKKRANKLLFIYSFRNLYQFINHNLII